MIALGIAAAVLIAVLPLLVGVFALFCLLTAPLGYLFFVKGVMPFSERFHTLHLFADWRFALAVGRDEAMARDWIEDKARSVLVALEQGSDEVLFVSHSMGASLALAVAGRVLELKPDAFDGRHVSFVTLGGAALQCALLSSASRLREHRRDGAAWRCELVRYPVSDRPHPSLQMPYGQADRAWRCWPAEDCADPVQAFAIH